MNEQRTTLSDDEIQTARTGEPRSRWSVTDADSSDDTDGDDADSDSDTEDSN
jgi:hypothetical protein